MCAEFKQFIARTELLNRAVLDAIEPGRYLVEMFPICELDGDVFFECSILNILSWC